jgi:RecQ family ATP-dependent DNA helicase
VCLADVNAFCVKTLGHSLHEKQQDVIDAILQKRDALVLWRTGFGKSLCFQLLPMMMEGTTCIVFCPLISLMRDQCNWINAHFPGEMATFLGQAQSDMHAMDNAVNGRYRIVYVSPELGTSDRFIRRIRPLYDRGGISQIAVDEAHCIVEWGTTFRKNFLNISKIRDAFPALPIVAVTATATFQTVDTIKKNLKLHDNLFVSKTTFDCRHLHISVVEKHGEIEENGEKIANSVARGESTIIYVRSRSECDNLASALQRQNIDAKSYHAEKSVDQRNLVQDAFFNDEIHVVVATTAFGMGVNKPDVRNIIHYGAPASIQQYIQEIGRGGRDGKPTRCVMMYDSFPFFVEESMREFVRCKKQCRRRALMEYFDEPFHGRCLNCDVCDL